MTVGLLAPLGNVLASLSGGDWVDICCAAAALISIGGGARRGLSAELPLGVGWFCGILAAWYAYAPLHSYCTELPFMENEPEFLLFLSLFSAALLAGGVTFLVTRGLRTLAVHVEKTPADSMLGTVVGVIRAFVFLLIVTAILMGQPWWKNGRETFCHQSQTGKLFSPMASTLLETVKKFNPHFTVRRRTDDPGDFGAPPPSK